MRNLCLAPLVLIGMHQTSLAQSDSEGIAIDWEGARIEGEILYRLEVEANDETRARIGALVGAVEDEELWPGVIYRMVLPAGANLVDAIGALDADPRVRYAEPNYVARAIKKPNDPSYSQQWAWDNANDADIDAPEAWDLATDASSVRTAIIDTGIQWDHPDLAANVWTNPGEIPGNSVDDDGNGYVDDVHGYDFVNDDGNPMDDNSHGTHTSGTIGAVTDNGVGVAGACWSASLIGVKFLDSGGSGSYADAVSSFAYCVAVGAKLSNNSWGGTSYSQSLYDAIDLAGDAGHLTVCAAGNSGNNSDNNPLYPGAYNLPEIVNVAATDSNDDKTSWSNYGPTSVDLGAPGDDILSTVRNNGYSSYSGTSMACPHACGVAAMVYSVSGSSDPLEVKQLLLAGVDVIPSMQGRVVSDGRLNYFNTLSLVRPISFEYPSGRPGSVAPQGGDVFRVNVVSGSGDPVPSTLQLHVDYGDGFMSVPADQIQVNEYDVEFPGLPGTNCGEEIAYYLSAEATDGNIYSDPGGAPSSSFSTTVVSTFTDIVDLDFESAPGWSVDNTNLADGAWELGVPVDGDRGDPPNDYDGSGQCFVTDNVAGDSDVDGGPTRLLSPAYDLTGAGGVKCSYARWFYNDDGDSDSLDVHVSSDDGNTWTLVESLGGSGGWAVHEFDVSDYVSLTDQFRIRFSVTDDPNNSITESGIDRFQLAGIQCAMSIAVTPATAVPTEFVDLTTWKGRPGGLCRLMVMAVDGVPLTLPLALGPFNAVGDYSLGGNLPNNPNLSGHSIGFQSFGVSPSGAIAATNMATLVIQ